MNDKQKTTVYQRMLKKDYLEGVRGRLSNDVGVYFNAIEREAQNNNHVGFFGAVRLLMPTIEAVASTTFKGQRKKQRLLLKLNVEYPELVWQGFRHSLAHNDHLGVIHYRGKKVSWSTSHSGLGHIFQSGQIHIDTRSLYNSLVDYLDNEIKNADNKHVYVNVGVRYRNKASNRVKKELKDIFS